MAERRRLSPMPALGTALLLWLLICKGTEGKGPSKSKMRPRNNPGNALKPLDKDKGPWFCTEATGDLVPLDSKQDTVERCWAEAVRRRARYLALDLLACRVGSSGDQLPTVPCTNTSRHVLDVQYYQRDLTRLDPDTRYWISGRAASGVIWHTASGATENARGLADCSNVCFEYGQDYARVDHRGCRCGQEEERGMVMIRHEDLQWTAGNRGTYDPGFTVKLRAQNVTGWMCTAAPSDFVAFTGAQTMQEALEACQRRRFQFLAAGEDGFFCGNNTANLERFSISQCEMRLTRRRSYSIISINEIERQITHVEESIREYIFWWVSEKSPDVFWTTLADVSSLEQCVLQCSKRFICVGADGCSCGSLRSDKSDVRVREWVKKRHKQELGSNQGFLMLDKEGNANVPEGWTCTTEPTQWRQTQETTLQRCLESCLATNNSFAAFGQSGCRCGDSGEGFRHLAMAHCQNPRASVDLHPHSVLFVDVWTHNYRNYSAKTGFQAFWVARKPNGVRWEAAPGRTVLDDCVSACKDRKGVKLVLVGVDGCECGYTTSGEYTPELAWLSTPARDAARGFLLVQLSEVSTGYVAPVFSWVTKRNNTHQKENAVKEAPTWIRVSVADTNRRHLRRLSQLTKEETLTRALERTADTSGSRGLTQRREHTTMEQRTNTLLGTHQRTTNTTGATEQKEISELTRNTQKSAKTNREKNVMNESERNYVSARDNEITVGSNKRRLVNIETENAAKQSDENYKKHTITGEQTAGTIEQFISGEKAHLVRVNSTNTKLLEKKVAANQTHLATEATSHKIRRLHLKQSRVTETKKGKTLSLKIHIGGRCYIGKAKKEEWEGPLPDSHTPFKCLCTCIKKMRLLYAIYDGGQCFCSEKAGDFGTNTGSITTTGRCPQKDARTVYNGMQHTQKLAQFCQRSDTAASSVLHLGRTTLNAGQREIEFNNTENLRALKKSSKLQSTHLRRSEEDVKTDVVREHKKRGTIRETWKSKLSKGVFDRLYRLKLHVRRAHNVTENVNLITKKDVRSSTHARAPLFLPPGKSPHKRLKLLLVNRAKDKDKPDRK